MKKTLKTALIILLSAVCACGAAACSSSSATPSTPEEAIKDAYGDTQYKITFDATGLEEPLSDMYYSADSMPTLPTPEKVGYVFAGWYFDSSLTDYCDVTNGDLYWKMCNVTLYPKWEKEAIENNGTYALEYEAKILEGSVVKGIYAEKYGWRNFCDDINSSGTYIEKNDNGTYLRIEYDCRERGPIFVDGEFAIQTYTVSDSEGRVDSDLSIFDRTSSEQVLYYNIDGLELDETITLNISYYNWSSDIPDDEREQAAVSYKVNFNITRFIGYTQSFVNTEGKLEDGIYMLPTHYTGLDKSVAVLDSFHPVYAYIIAEKGNYTLVKPLSAYNSDINGNLSDNDYFDGGTGYARDFTCFLTDQSNVCEEDAEATTYDDYIPEKLKAKSYSALTYEFHADTGAYYYTVNLGTTLTNDVILFGGSTGAMEQMFGFPFSWRRLCLGYDSMVRISDWDYKEVSGDSFTYKTQAPFYAGYTSADFAESNADFDILQTTALAVRMVNLFFASGDGGKTGTQNYSSKMTVTPTAQTAAGNLSDMRYQFSTFDIIYEAFGYDVKTDDELYSHAINYLALCTPTASTDSDVVKVEVGKTVAVGETVNLTDLYLEKVYSSATAASLSWQGYELDGDGNADFTKAVTLEGEFTFENGVAVYYTSKETNSTRTGLVILQPEEKAENVTIHVDGWTYDEESGVYRSDARYKIDDWVEVPEVTWRVSGRSYTTRTLIKYDDDTPWTSELYVAVWQYSGGVYTRVYSAFTDNMGSYDIFKMSASVMRVEIRLYNRFGEFESIFLEYRGENAGNYGISTNGETKAEGDLTYTDGVRNAISFTEIKTDEIATEQDLLALPVQYTMTVTDSDKTSAVTLPLASITVYLKNSTQSVTTLEEAWELINGENYALLRLNYQSDYGDSVTRSAIYGFTIDIKSVTEYEFFDGGSDIFTGEEFEFEKPKLAGKDYLPLSRPYALNVYKLSGFNWTSVHAASGEYTLTVGTYGATLSFNQEGTYLVAWNYSLSADFNGNKIFAAYNDDTVSSFSVYLARKVTVNDKNCDITVTYVTDSAHPFNRDKIADSDIKVEGGCEYYTTTVSMAERNSAPSYSYFTLSDGCNDRLWGWGSSWESGSKLFAGGSNIGSLGVTLHSLTPTVYALWDDGFTVAAYLEIGGTTVELGSATYYRQGSYGQYEIRLSDFHSYFNESAYTAYEIVCWRATEAVFREYENGKYVYYNTYECGTTSQAFSSAFFYYSDTPFTLTAVLRKKLTVSYQAVDENGNPLEFTSSLRIDRNCLEGYTVASRVGESMLKTLKSVTCTDSTKEFKYWAVMVDGKLVEFDIENDVFTSEHFGTGSTVVLYAVFGDKT